MDKKIIELEHGDSIPYVWKDRELGVAEFGFCVVWKRKLIREIWVQPVQQANQDLYHLDLNSERLQFETYPENGHPSPWLYSWCNEHKCMNIRVYCPPETKYLYFFRGSTFEILFSKEHLS